MIIKDCLDFWLNLDYRSVKSTDIDYVLKRNPSHGSYIVDIKFDQFKNDRNIAERGLSFKLVEELDWSTALIIEDIRKDYGESRFRVLGLINMRLHAVVFTPRRDKVHVISLRKANQREVRFYEWKNESRSGRSSES
jgi:uncharacterized DUF497 family protein